MPDFLLEAIQLTKFYGVFPALRQTSFALRRGEVLALLGPNGAGKTTLLHLLALVMWPTSGALRLDGVEMAGEARRAARASIGLLGHQTFLYDELTARENLEFFARLYGVAHPAARAAQQLESVRLSQVADELARHLSRGMRQRLALARVFLHEPALALLDEPFTGLDEAATVALCDLVERWRAAGRSVILSSHDVDLALELATSVLVMENGQVSYFGENSRSAAEAIGRIRQPALRRAR